MELVSLTENTSTTGDAMCYTSQLICFGDVTAQLQEKPCSTPTCLADYELYTVILTSYDYWFIHTYLCNFNK